jgi:hypothetical protein
VEGKAKAAVRALIRNTSDHLRKLSNLLALEA